MKLRPLSPVGPVLVTGFEPFGGEPVNPSQQIAAALHGRVIEGRTVVGLTLPCVFGVALDALDVALRTHRPALVVCVGQSGGRADLTPERVAINVDDARIPDNAGRQPVDTPVVAGGPAAYWSGLPIKAIVAALRARGLPASVSQTAGTFVCNHVFYGLMHRLARLPEVRGGFVHVPFSEEQKARNKSAPALPLATLIEGIAVAVATSLTTVAELRIEGGRTD